MRRRVVEAVLLFVGIAVLIGWERPVEEPIALESLGDVVRPRMELPPLFPLTTDSVASVHGIGLDMNEAQANQALQGWETPRRYSDNFLTLERDEHSVTLAFDEDGKTLWVGGCCLEIDGDPCLQNFEYTPENIRILLGPPNAEGLFGGRGCVLPSAGCRYSQIDATIAYWGSHFMGVKLTREFEFDELMELRELDL